MQSCPQQLSQLSSDSENEHPPSNNYSLKELLLTLVSPKWKIRDNSESTARDLLAAERTMLSWIRIALGASAISIGISKFVTPKHTAMKTFIMLVSICILLCGFLLLLYGHIRNTVVTEKLKLNKFPSDAFGPFVFMIAGGIVCILAIIIVVVK